MILNKLARYALILLVIIVCAVQLPFFYYKLVHKPSGSTRFYYSPIINDYAIMQHGEGNRSFTDNQGNTYNRRSFEKILPFQFYRDLSKWGVFPDTIHGMPMDASVIHHNSDRYRVMGKDFDMPNIKLYPLFESESDFAQLQFPSNFFRIGETIEFIKASSNSIDEGLSDKFNTALVDAGFAFPSKIIAGNPTTKKPFDEGYFIQDNSNAIFHMKKVKGEPLIVKTPIPTDLNIRKILIQKSVSRKIYGLMITENNKLYMISYDNYMLLPVELDDYIADQMNLAISVDPMYVNFSYNDNYTFYSAVYDSNYQYIDKIRIAMTPKEEKITEKVKYAIFPFSISTGNNFSNLKQFDFKMYYPLSLMGIILSLILGFIIKVKRQEDMKTSWPDFIIIALSGIYGLIAVFLIKSDIWE